MPEAIYEFRVGVAGQDVISEIKCVHKQCILLRKAELCHQPRILIPPINLALGQSHNNQIVSGSYQVLRRHCTVTHNKTQRAILENVCVRALQLARARNGESMHSLEENIRYPALAHDP